MTAISRSPDNGQAAAGDKLAAAVAYADAGLPVFPLAGKVPRTSDGLKAATTDAETVAGWWQRWPDADVGVRTGAASGLVVLDVDVAHGGAGTLAELERVRGKLPVTAEVLTGGGGRHVYFRHPGVEIKNSAGKLGHGVDVRGDGGYVCAPPSVHESGRVYQWTRPLERGLADAPVWLLEDAERRRNGAAPKVEGVIPFGQQHASLVSLAGSMRHRGCTADEIYAALAVVNLRCERPGPDENIRKIASSVERYEPDADAAVPVVARAEPRGLDEVVSAFRNWLHLPDPGALYVALAAIAANRLPGDPVWLLLVAASSSGKTEILFALGDLGEVVPAATLTEASLLSGVPKKDHTAGSTGGLLRKIGDYGILALKDFGSILSMHRDARASVLAALRECYDGSWDRPLGVDGGRVLHWEGKLGLIAGVTGVVDSHHSVMDSLGSRFALYRVDVDERADQGERAIGHRRSAKVMRGELRDAVSGFFAGLELPEDDALTDADRRRLVPLADFVTMARSPVERDGYSREIELIPPPEAPARFAVQLATLLEGLKVIGLDSDAAWQLVEKIAFDSMPTQRRRLIEFLTEVGETTTKAAAIELGLPTTTTRRTLEDLTAHGVVLREAGEDGPADRWRLSAWTRARYRRTSGSESG